jgi:hypothetical protein
LIWKESEMNTQTWTNSSLGEVVRANRIPLALIGVGAAWLLANSAGLADRLAQDERVQTARRRIGEIATDIGIGGAAEPDKASATGQIFGPDGEPLTRTTDRGRSDGWVHHATGAARGAIGSVREAGTTVLDRAGDYAGNAGDLAKRAGDQVVGRLQSDPWLIGVVGLVAGALFAVMLPPTKIEQEYITDTRDELWNRATELGHDAAERVRELADSTVRASRR